MKPCTLAASNPTFDSQCMLVMVKGKATDPTNVAAEMNGELVN